VFELPYTIIRPSALYGPRCVSRRVGQVFIENALNGSKLVVEGDGSERLDFTYIDDLVDGVCLTIRNPVAYNQVFNMTYGHARSIQELVAIIRRHFPEVQLESAPRSELLPMRGTLSAHKAAALLGYAPKHPLEQGLAKYIEWYLSLNDDPLAAAALP
jgi:nucleoside-diphosphate-sugar epimerase